MLLARADTDNSCHDVNGNSLLFQVTRLKRKYPGFRASEAVALLREGMEHRSRALCED